MATGAVYSATGPGAGTLALTLAGQTVATLSLAGNYAGSSFLTVPDGVDGTLVLLASGSVVAGGALSAGTSGPDAYVWNVATGGMWDVAANWRDVSSRTTPAVVAPGSKDIVTLAGPTGDSIALIGGPGNSASLIVTGAVALSGVFATGGLTVGTKLASGTLDIVAGGTLTTTTPSDINGTLEVSGAGALFSVNGILTVGPQTPGLSPPVVEALNGGYIKQHLLTLNGGTILVDATSTIEVGTPGNAAAGALTVDGGYTLTSNGGTIDGAVIDKGTLMAASGLTSVFGGITSSGVLDIGAGGTLFLAGSVAATNTVNFTASSGRLMLYGTGSGFAAPIAGMTAGDAIDISGVTITGAVFTAINASKGTLTLSTNGVAVMTLTLSGAYAGAVFQTSPDGIDGTLISLAAGGSGAGLLSAGTATPDVYRWAASGGGDWGSAANWVDSSLGSGAAVVAPGSNDAVTIAAAAGAVTLLTGQGAAASLSISGNVAFSARVAAGAVTASAATLDVDAAGTLGAGSMGFASGVLQVGGVGAVLAVGGTLTFGPVAAGASGPRVTVVNQGEMQAGALVLNGATIAVDGVSAIEVGSAGGAAAGVVTVDAGATLTSDGGVVGSAMVVNGVLLAEAGTTSLLSDANGAGTLVVGAGATLSVYGVVGAGETVAFAGESGRLVLNAAANGFAGVVSGFVPGDEIDIAAATLTGADAWRGWGAGAER